MKNKRAYLNQVVSEQKLNEDEEQKNNSKNAIEIYFNDNQKKKLSLNPANLHKSGKILMRNVQQSETKSSIS